jgi:hypothetical protein
MPSIVRWAGSDPKGRFVVTVTAWSPSFWTSSMSWYTNDLISLPLSRTRLRVNTTLSAVKGLPSWKLTPLRRVNRQVVLLTGRQVSASAGTNLSSLVTSRSGS